LFAANCASCHGPAGLGNGNAAPSLLPQPANLTAARFSDERLSGVLWNGIPGSSMPPWRQLPAEDLRTLIAYVQSLRVPDAPFLSHAAASVDQHAAASVDQGKALFAANCASCHGDRGSGDGPTAGALVPPPTNFGLQQPTHRRALEVLEKGVPGTAMPPWKSQLDEGQRQALADFVCSLYSLPGEN
jgi:mono/diheme cytochrome c family protein